ncbi:hypothetical protein [Polaromonas eurypsychrophila]|uniref:hypothetical protein n=1 Tax=Polaromonas eurypsychrophila TaxID=1614635 RepID=UPI00166864C5|nr:hypothetical protein [Polaromonas eurypsychrophila]
MNYKIKNLATLKAACERFTPFGEAASGVFRNTGKLEVTQPPGKSNELEIKFQRTVTGQPKGQENGQVAFIASCQVSCLIIFDEAQSNDLPEPLLRELTAPLFFVAAERCRHLVSSMGYPSPVVNAMPLLEVSKPDSQPAARVSTINRPAKSALASKSRTKAKA